MKDGCYQWNQCSMCHRTPTRGLASSHAFEAAPPNPDCFRTCRSVSSRAGEAKVVTTIAWRLIAERFHSREDAMAGIDSLHTLLIAQLKDIYDAENRLT